MPCARLKLKRLTVCPLPPSGLSDELPRGKEVEFINLIIPPDKGSDKGSDKGPDKVALSVADWLKGIGNTDETAKAPAVQLGDGLPPIPAKMAAEILNGEFVEMADLFLEAWTARKSYKRSGRKRS